MSFSRAIRRSAVQALTGLVAAFALSPPAGAAPATSARHLELPLAFERNLGQSAPEVDFLARGPGYTLFLAGGEAVFAFQGAGDRGTCALTMRFEGAQPFAPAFGEQLLAGKSRYIHLDGSPRTSGEADHFGRVRYTDLLDGVDLLFYGREGQLEYDLELAPGQSATPPVLELDGASDLSVGSAGELRIGVCGTEVVFQPPVAFQEAAAGRRTVTADYRMLPGGRATFVLGDHDPALPLVIDPVFSYSTCLAGTADDAAYDLAVDATGAIYVVGTTTSADFPTRNPIHGYGGGEEVFVSKLNADGSDLVYSTYAGNNADHQSASGVAVSSAGEAFVTGSTCPADYSPCQAYLMKLSATGGFAFSSIFGGSYHDRGAEVAIDTSGNAVVVGTTGSSDFPVLNAVQPTIGGMNDAFVRRYSSTGTLLSSTYLGGPRDQQAYAVALGPNNAIYVGGRSDDNDWAGDAFVTKLNAAASSVVYSRTFGGSGADYGFDLAVDAGSRAYLVGTSQSGDFPVTGNAIFPTWGGYWDGFLTILDSAGSASFVASTYLGADYLIDAEGVALGPQGEVYITGTDGGGSADVFLLKIANTFTSIIYSVHLGNTGYEDSGQAVRVDSTGAAYVVGRSLSGEFFPSTPGAFQACITGGSNGFAAKVVDGTPALSVGNVSVTEGNAGTTVASFPVTLSAAPLGDVTYSWATANGTATTPADYEASSGTGAWIGAGQTSGTIEVNVVGDTLDEANETFLLNVSSVVGATVADSQGQATILDDDAAPTLSVSNCTVTEGNAGTVNCAFSVSLSASSAQTITVSRATANGTAVAPGDYTALAAATLTFNPGETAKVVNVAVVGDTLDEANETFSLNLSSPVNATIADGTGIGTITDDDATPTLSVSDCTVTEGNSGTVNCAFTVSLSAASGQSVTVSRTTANGTATAPGDYTALAAATITFNPGETSKVVNVAVAGDTLDEPNETFTLNLSSPVNATIADGTGIGTITDDDATPTLSVSDCTVTEGNSGTVNCAFTVSLSAASGQTVTVSRATANGTAVAPGDYTALAAATLTFTAGQTSQVVNVAVAGDTLDEPNETFTLNLSTPVNATILDGTGVGTITDDDAAPTLSVSDCTVTEGNFGTVNCAFTVSLSAASGQTVTVSRATANGTAVAPGDYTALAAATITFNPGETSKVVNVAVAGDTLDEPNETFTLNLSTPVNATILDGTGVGTITDDDAAPTLSVSDCTVTEGNSGTVNCAFTVSLSVASGQSVTVSRTTANGTATAPGDYSALAAATLTFTAGQTSQVVNVAVAGDTLEEANETFTLNLSSPTNATITDALGTGTITDDDALQISEDGFESGDLSGWDAGRGALEALPELDDSALDALGARSSLALPLPGWVSDGIGEAVYAPVDLFGEAPATQGTSSVALLAESDGAEIARLALGRGGAIGSLRVRLSLGRDTWCRTAVATTEAVPEPVVRVRRLPSGAWELEYGQARFELPADCSVRAE
ncbi:MAG: hypothetical protein IPJ17_03040 [Holophagales bacterium]|nr:MAG: hypothetical protein IPJ17_03040 [Holophagales bacterium]